MRKLLLLSLTLPVLSYAQVIVKEIEETHPVEKNLVYTFLSHCWNIGEKITPRLRLPTNRINYNSSTPSYIYVSLMITQNDGGLDKFLVIKSTMKDEKKPLLAQAYPMRPCTIFSKRTKQKKLHETTSLKYIHFSVHFNNFFRADDQKN